MNTQADSDTAHTVNSLYLSRRRRSPVYTESTNTNVYFLNVERVARWS